MCFVGSSVVVSSTTLLSPSGLPFLISCSYLVVLEPGLPSWSTTFSPLARVSSSMISTSNGIGQVSSYSYVPVKSLVPTITFCLALVTTSSVVCSISPVSGLYLLTTLVSTLPGVSSPVSTTPLSLVSSYTYSISTSTSLE